MHILEKDNTHYFINDYVDSDVRVQSSNFADIPITVDDLESILCDIDEIDAFILNPLNAFDFPIETIDYLKSFEIPVFMSVQGLLRYPSDVIGEGTYSIALNLTTDLKEKIRDIYGLFLDEAEASILFEKDDFNVHEIIVTDGSRGSRVMADREYKIRAVKCDNVIDSTGCGDTFMAAYISKRLKNESIVDSANFASRLASEKLRFDGPIRL